MSFLGWLHDAPYLAAGFALGAIYFRLLDHAVRLHVAGGPVRFQLALTLGRIALAAAAFWAIAQSGPAPLLFAFVGFLLSRGAMRRLLGAA